MCLEKAILRKHWLYLRKFFKEALVMLKRCIGFVLGNNLLFMFSRQQWCAKGNSGYTYFNIAQEMEQGIDK